MKSRNWLVYTIIFIFSAIYVFNHEKYTKRIEIINGYCENFSVNRGQDLEFYLNPKADHKKGVVCIYDVHNKIVDSLILDLKVQTPNSDKKLYEHGYNYINKFSFNTKNLKSGIYLFGNVVPFLVKETQIKNSITVVFPYANFMALSNEGGKSFDSGNSSDGLAAEVLSLKRGLWLSNNPFFFINWIDSVYHGKSVNYISDLDLEDQANIQQSNVLVLFGYSSFWSSKQRENFDSFIDGGKNVLAICSNLMNNKFRYNPENNTLAFKLWKNEDLVIEPEKALGLWSQIKPNISSIGCSYELGYERNVYKKSLGGFKIIQMSHPIFNFISDSLIILNNENTNSIAVDNIDFKRFPIALKDDSNFISKEILAYDHSIQNGKQTVTGIFLIKRSEKSGKLLIIGNEKWCWKNSLSNSVIQRITKNSMDYLRS
jgi:hypothetical protein